MGPQGAGVVFMLLVRTGNGTVAEAAMGPGPPEKGAFPLNPTAAPRVSTRRQGVMPTKVSGVGGTSLTGWISGTGLAADRSAGLGCQYRGVSQFFSGITLSR